MRTSTLPFADDAGNPAWEVHQDPYTGAWYMRDGPLSYGILLSPVIERWSVDDVLYRLPQEELIRRVTGG